MCSNRTNLAFNRNNNNTNNNQIKLTTSAFPFTTNSNKSSLEHVYYAKLVNFDRQRRLNKQNDNECKSSSTSLTNNNKNSNEIDLSQQIKRLRNVSSKLKNNNNNNNNNISNDYESLINIDSELETTNNKISKKTNKNEDSRSTSSCCSSSIEKITEEDVELDDDDVDEGVEREEEEDEEVKQSDLANQINVLKLTSSSSSSSKTKSVIKILESKRKYSNSTNTSSASSSATGSFSSSSASSISSALSSITTNNQLSSSASSSSSSSPNFLSTSKQNTSNTNALFTDSTSSLYSSNYKIRNSKLKSNDLILVKPKEDSKSKLDTFKSNSIQTTPPAKPSTPPPQLSQQQQQLLLDKLQLNDSLVNSNSATRKTQTMSSWLQSSTNSKQLLNDSEKKLIKIDSTTTSNQNRHATNFTPIDSVGGVSTRENNKILADRLLQYSRMNTHMTSSSSNLTQLNNKNKSIVKLIKEANNEKLGNQTNEDNLYCDLNEYNQQQQSSCKNVETINQNNGVVFRDNCYYVNKTKKNEITNDYASNTNNKNNNKTNKREFYVLNDKNEILSQEEQIEVEEGSEEEELNDEETTATEELIDSKETTQLSTRNYYYDSTLLTPLKPITSSEAKIITNEQATKRINIKSNKKQITESSSSSSSSTTCVNTNIKSASTSYLLSKITSIASLTLPKHSRTATTTAPVESILNNLTSPATSTASASSSSSSANPSQTSKSLKLFNMPHSSTNTSTSPCLIFNSHLESSNHLSMSPSAVNNKFSSSVSSSSSSSYIFNHQYHNQQQTNQPISRRPFKKRSQSTHNNILNKITWYYNHNDDCWYKTQSLIDSNQSSPKTSFSSTLKKRKSLNNKIASVVGTKSMSSFLTNADTSTSDDLTNQSISPCSVSFTDSFACASTRIRLTQINMKHLTLVELKYLKQICFNKLQKLFQSLQSEQQKLRKQQLNKTTNSSNNTNNSNNNSNPFAIRLSIPKDESIKTTKTKSIAIRSKSVDFKFFDEFRENYLSKKSSNSNQQQVFGQSLYKCILNDLEQSSRITSSSTNVNKTGPTITTNKSDLKNNSSLLKSSSKKWRSNNQNNILIASKFDLNLLNELNTNENITQINCANTSTNNTDLLNSKRNSVLFEALDLKNMTSKSMLISNESTNKKFNLRLSSISSNMMPHLNENSSNRFKEDLQQMIANNQNLSIRSEGLVPNIVKSCCNHICEYGLDVVGIFRIDSSKKRIKEIKEMFDLGKEVLLNESFNSNDSACILKEYLRSLPEPLLTRDLYSSFLATCKIKDSDKRLEAVRLLICLLPVPNRDTLECLLKLLDKVKENANKQDESDKQKSTGNKMDAFNLAMVFGPNILKKHKLGYSSSSSKLNDYSADKYNLIDDIDSVISVTKYLIENHNSLFYIEANLHNELIQTINNLNPNELNAILTRKLISSIGLTKLDGLNGNLSDTSGYSSSVKSTNNHVLVSKSSTDESLSSPLNCFSSSETNNQYLTGDFIDYKMCKHRSSRTKLHKIVDNFNLIHSKDTETICFVNSPSHSPQRSQQQQQQQSHLLQRHYKRNANKSTFSNEIYNNQIVDSYLNPNRNNSISSSLLLMIQSNEKSTQGKLAKHNKFQHQDDLLTKATKSLSNLNQQHQANLIDKRRQSSGTGLTTFSSNTTNNTSTSNLSSKPPQYKLINSNTIQICSKFYDKTKYNIIGEQETLV